MADVDPQQLRDAHQVRRRAQDIAGEFPPLMIAAQRVANSIAYGLHGRQRAGMGESFWEYRRYRTGDAITKIDWRQSARSQHLYLRENEWDAAQSIWLWISPDQSMDYASEGQAETKRERALLLALALASLLVRAGERIAALGGSFPPTTGRTGLLRLAEELVKPKPISLQDLAHSIPKHSELVIISDFLRPIEELETELAELLRMGVRGHLVQLNDPAEESFPFQGRVRFQNMDMTDTRLFGDAEEIAKTYRQRFQRHRDNVSILASRFGWTWTWHNSAHSPAQALLSIHQSIETVDSRRRTRP